MLETLFGHTHMFISQTETLQLKKLKLRSNIRFQKYCKMAEMSAVNILSKNYTNVRQLNIEWHCPVVKKNDRHAPWRK